MDRIDSAARPGLILASLAGLLIATGCSSNEKTTIAVSPSEFVKPEQTPGPDRQDAVAKKAGSLRVTAERSGPVAETDGILDVSPEVGTPTINPDAEVAPSLAKGEAFIDAKVGDINNKAIYASEFLEPMGARLAAEAKKLKPDAWRKFASDLIREELVRMRDDELLRAEALSELKPEQRQGLAAMMDRWMEEQRLAAGGSSQAAQERLYNTKGQTLDEAVSEREKAELITFTLRRKVIDPVQITRQDLELTYEKLYPDYNPDPTAYLREILVDPTKTAAIADIRSQLEAGVPFIEVASRPENDYRPSRGGQLDPIKLKGTFNDTTFFAVKELNEAVKELRPGQWAGPIRYKLSSGAERVAFLFLERVEEVSTSFYDAQLSMENGLRDVAIRRAKAKYLEDLLRRASYTPLPEMVDRLLKIAEERYGPEAVRR